MGHSRIVGLVIDLNLEDRGEVCASSNLRVIHVLAVISGPNAICGRRRNRDASAIKNVVDFSLCVVIVEDDTAHVMVVHPFLGRGE